jgi:outer membrane murein-binding lipoprotein Lpp
MMFWALIPSWVKLYAAMAVIAALVIAGAYFKGRMDQGAVCKEAALQVKIAGLERDRTAQRLADATEDAERITLQKMLETAEAEIAAYEIELQSRPNPNCALSPRDIDSLYGGKR